MLRRLTAVAIQHSHRLVTSQNPETKINKNRHSSLELDPQVVNKMSTPQEDITKVFCYWSSILVLKMMAMPLLTARQRFRKKVFANAEDTGFGKSGKVSYEDPDVERVRRAHRNDLENILPWFMITYVWLGTNPSYGQASFLIRAFVLSRLSHTLVYAIIPAQPWRAIAFFVGFGITGYQALSTLIHYA